MKIAVIAPSPVPFTIGGTEKLCFRLAAAINEMTTHETELIKVPSPESDFSHLIMSYRKFFELDLSHFDCVISTKYPSWMVRHPRHYCYMFHRLRGLYDTYFGEPIAKLDSITCPFAKAILKKIERSSGEDEEIIELFSMLDEFSAQSAFDPSLLHLPGPFLQKIIHFLDNAALSRHRISGYFAISSNVAKRPNYFPAGIEPTVIHPPSSLPFFRKGKYEYLLSVSRLDGPKRVSLLIEAMRHVRSKVEVLIAGVGPQEDYLRDLAAGDNRIKFLGFLSDNQLIDLYANALAVVFIPYDEDYGLVTIEAMKSAKPVITSLDAGGPNEFVIDGKTGFSVNPDPKSLAEKISHITANPEQAALMGEAGSNLVADITWEKTVELLTARFSPQSRHSRVLRRRKKIVVTSTFSVFPPLHGGQCRLFHLYRHLARFFDIEIVAVTPASEPPSRKEISRGLFETRVPKSSRHESKELELSRENGYIAVTDIAMPELIHLTPDYYTALAKASAAADIIVVSHPYLVTTVKEIGFPKFIYEAHNVEYHLKSSILPSGSASKRLLELVRETEEGCCTESRIIICCSDYDKMLLSELYSIDGNKIKIVPNGADLDAATFVSMSERYSLKDRIGISDTTIALFIGSWHGPNIEATDKILDLARQHGDMQFLIAGSVCDALNGRRRPSNVGFLGIIEEGTKEVLLGAADIALNPMLSGSGTNIKMIEYMAAGVPVLSTPMGARGLDLSDRIHFFMRPIDGFSEGLKEIRSIPVEELSIITEKAREVVSQKYDWSRIAETYKEILEQAMD